MRQTQTILLAILMIAALVTGSIVPALATSTTVPGTADSVTKNNVSNQSNSPNSLTTNGSVKPLTTCSGLCLEVPNSSAPGVTFFGHGGYSADGLGQSEGGGRIRAEVPAGSTIVSAYLYATYVYGGTNAPDIEIQLDGHDYHLINNAANQFTIIPEYKYTGSDLVSQVAAKYATEGPGIFDFVVNTDYSDLDGVGLVVIYSNPASPEVSIAVMDGGLSAAGATTTLGLASPLNTNVTGFNATLSLGIGYSYQSNSDIHGCGSGQVSHVDINNKRLTSCAGSYDDGGAYNGGLITIGGVGDSVNNPPDPNGPGGEDDELYSLVPFLDNGITQIDIKTQNPSFDDNIFLAIIEITAKAAINGNFGTPQKSTAAHETPHIPPSLIGDDVSLRHISDGFNIQGDSYTVPKYVNNIPTHRLILNEPAQIVVKAYDDIVFTGGITHTALYFGTHPVANALDSQVGIVWDKDKGVTVTDPSGYLKDVSVKETVALPEKIYTFTFTPVKPMKLSDTSVRIWNLKQGTVDRIFSNSVIFSGEFLTPSPMKMSSNFKEYDTSSDLENQLTADGYAKPTIFTKIHDTKSVFGDSPGKVTFTYDAENKVVSLVLKDGSDKIIGIQSQSLVKSSEPTSLYSHLSLSRYNPGDLEVAKSNEAIKAIKSMIDIYGRNYVSQYDFIASK